MKKVTITLITILLIFTLFLSIKKEVSANEYDPGTGRLSGEYITDDFYDETNLIKPDIKTYGSRKIKSPYTKVKYTHQTRFDNRQILQGIDISKWQGYIDWNKVKADGIDFAFIQVGFRGYGSSGLLDSSTKDPYFDTNMQNAIAAGIKVGVYVFSQAVNEAEAREEANYILDAIGNYEISMPLVLDYEYASTDSGLGGRLYKAKLSKKKATNVCMAFCKEIANAGFTPMVYANKSMLSDQLDADKISSAGYRIWLANYTKNTTYKGTFDFWQYSEKGSVKGITGHVDMNYYYVQPTDNFIPQPNSISSCVFSHIENQTYTGQPITPEIKITHNDVVLTPNVDYTITYQNNTNIGTAHITITGIGKFCDTRRFYYKILPKTPTGLKAKKKTTNYLTLSWAKDSSVTGYELYRASTITGTYKKIKTISKKSTITYKNTKLSAGKCYYYKIRSYKKKNGHTYYSPFSPAKSLYTKTGYTRNAIAKSKLVMYDTIPGTKTAVVLIPDPNVNTQEPTEPTDNNQSDTTNQKTDGNPEDTVPPSNEDTGETTTPPAGDDTGDSITPPDDNTTDEAITPPTDNTNSPNVPEPPKEVPMISVTQNVDSTPVIELPKNTTMKVIYSTTYKKATWYYVSYEKAGTTYKGFVKGASVTITKLGKIVKTKSVNVRKSASAYTKKITTLKKNRKVTILKTKKKKGVTWYQVQFKKNKKKYKGWISAPYIKLI